MNILNNLEKLEELASKNQIEIIENYDFESERIKGLYCDKVIVLNRHIDNRIEKSCVLAEELGHYYTTAGDIIDLHNITNKKQELRARMWAYDKQIGLRGIISAFRNRCMNTNDMAEYFNVTEDFLKEALLAYKNKYGMATKVDNYVIGFEPNLYVMELFE